MGTHLRVLRHYIEWRIGSWLLYIDIVNLRLLNLLGLVHKHQCLPCNLKVLQSLLLCLEPELATLPQLRLHKKSDTLALLMTIRKQTFVLVYEGGHP